MTITITRRQEFDMGHCLPDHEGKCHHRHGHRYAVEATVAGSLMDTGPATGMVADFASLAAAIDSVISHIYDHRFVMCTRDPRWPAAMAEGTDDLIGLAVPPTAENLAVEWATQLGRYLDPEHGILPGVALVALRVYETPNCWVDWTPDR